jgi:hypothetical protein
VRNLEVWRGEGVCVVSEPGINNNNGGFWRVERSGELEWETDVLY